MEEKVTIISWFIALFSFVGALVAVFTIKDILVSVGLFAIAVVSEVVAIRYGAIDGPEER